MFSPEELKRILQESDVIKNVSIMKETKLFENVYQTVFQGELELVVENRSYIVKSGEAIEFDATLPHRYINKGKTDVIAQAILSY